MHPIHHQVRFGERRGFTLIELLAALTVISVATTILLRLYVASTDLGNLAQHREVAASIADAQLSQIIANSGDFVWDVQNPDGQGFFRVKATADDPRAGVKATLPNVLIPQDSSHAHQANFYDKFRWLAFARIPNAESAYVEVTVTARWTQSGREERVALTGVVPRTAVDPTWGAK